MSHDKNAVRKILDQAKAAGREALTAPEARGICEAYGITIPKEGVATSADEAVKLASGIGFGVSEGIMYSTRYYNGIVGVDLYFVRFISCVALHAIWTASVAISLVRRQGEYEDVSSAGEFGVFARQVAGLVGPDVDDGGGDDELLGALASAGAQLQQALVDSDARHLVRA